MAGFYAHHFSVRLCDGGAYALISSPSLVKLAHRKKMVGEKPTTRLRPLEVKGLPLHFSPGVLDLTNVKMETNAECKILNN